MNNFKRYPSDRIGTGTVGIKLPANSPRSSSNDSLFNMSHSTEEQSISNYVNLLFTRQGERYMQPLFGVGLQYYLFEPNTESTRSTIETAIETQADLWLPYIINRQIDIITSIPLIDENTIGIRIIFSVTEYGANHELTIFNTSGRPTFEVKEVTNVN